MSEIVSRLFTERRVAMLVLSLLVTALLGSGIQRVQLDTSLSALLTRSDPYLEELDIMAARFPSDLDVVFAFIPGNDDSVFSPAVLDAIAGLNSRFDEIPYATRISSLLEYSDPQTQRRLFQGNYRQYSDTQLADLQQQALADPLLTANLLAPDARLSFAVVYADGSGLTTDQRIEIAAAAATLRDELRVAHPAVDIHVSGDVLLEQSSQQAMLSDLSSFLPFVIFVCALLICYCFRSVILGACILAHEALVIVCTVGALSLLGVAFNSVSVIAPLVVAVISVANSVHIVSLFQQALAQGLDGKAAVGQSLQLNFRPVTMAALTTAIGFSSLNLCSSPAIQDFGRIVTVGILFAYALTLTFLPALLVWLWKPIAAHRVREFTQLHNTLKRIIDFTQSRDRAIFWSCSLLAILTFALLPLNETDFNRLDFIANDEEISAYYDAISERMNRGPSLTYAIDTGNIDGAIEPAFLRTMEEFSQWIIDRDDVESAASLVDVVKAADLVLGSGGGQGVIPGQLEQVAFYLDAYSQVENADFPLSGFINHDYSTITLVVNATPMSNQGIIDLDRDISDRFAEALPQATLIHGSGVLLFARMDELVTVELLQGYALSLALITLCMSIGLGSLYFGILSVVPNMLPATMVFGVWALFVGQVDPFVMMLFSISIGLVVDDSVHILSHYLERRRHGGNKAESIARSIRIAGPALSITTLVLAFGTTILIGANTVYFQQAAKLLVPIVVLALALDLVFLPTVLKRFDNRFPESAI